MYPDGGIARFRVYGHVSPVFPPIDQALDLAHVYSGGRVVFVSDQHFGIGPNLLLPGRGKSAFTTRSGELRSPLCVLQARIWVMDGKLGGVGSLVTMIL